MMLCSDKQRLMRLIVKPNPCSETKKLRRPTPVKRADYDDNILINSVNGHWKVIDFESN